MSYIVFLNYYIIKVNFDEYIIIRIEEGQYHYRHHHHRLAARALLYQPQSCSSHRPPESLVPWYIMRH